MSVDAQRRLILHMAVSLDGVGARSDGVIDWLSTRRPGGVDRWFSLKLFRRRENRAGRRYVASSRAQAPRAPAGEQAITQGPNPPASSPSLFARRRR